MTYDNTHILDQFDKKMETVEKECKMMLIRLNAIDNTLKQITKKRSKLKKIWDKLFGRCKND